MAPSGLCSRPVLEMSGPFRIVLDCLLRRFGAECAFTGLVVYGAFRKGGICSVSWRIRYRQLRVMCVCGEIPVWAIGLAGGESGQGSSVITDLEPFRKFGGRFASAWKRFAAAIRWQAGRQTWDRKF